MSKDDRSSLLLSTAEFTVAHLNGREPCSEVPQSTNDQQPHLVQKLPQDATEELPSSKPVDTAELDGSSSHAPDSYSAVPPASQDVHSAEEKQHRQDPHATGDKIRDFPLTEPGDEPLLIPLSFEVTSAYVKKHNIPSWQVEQFHGPDQNHQLSQQPSPDRDSTTALHVNDTLSGDLPSTSNMAATIPVIAIQPPTPPSSPDSSSIDLEVPLTRHRDVAESRLLSVPRLRKHDIPFVHSPCSLLRKEKADH